MLQSFKLMKMLTPVGTSASASLLSREKSSQFFCISLRVPLPSYYWPCHPSLCVFQNFHFLWFFLSTFFHLILLKSPCFVSKHFYILSITTELCFFLLLIVMRLSH